MPQLQRSPYSDVTADDINATYRQGYITAQQRNDIMRRKAQANVNDILAEDGFFKGIWTQTIQNLQENWDVLKEIAATPEKDITVINDMKNGVRASWAMIQLALAPLNAVGEISGAKAEQAALWAGASPGLAKTIGIAVNVGSAFVPIGATARGAAKGVQAVGKAVSKGKAAGQAAQAAQVAKTAENVVEAAVKEGLAKDGVKGLIEEAGGAVETAGKELTTHESFLKSLRQFRREMGQITATKSHETTLAEAEKLGLGIEDLKQLPLFSKLNEAEMASYLKALDQPVDELINLSKSVLKGDVDGAQLGKAFQQFFEYAPKFRASEVTAGRTVEILKETPPMKGLTDLMAGWVPEAMAKLEPSAVWKTLAEDILALADEPGKLKNLQVQGAQEVAISGFQKWWAYGREAYINLLLARPVTQVRNFLGNSFAAVNSAVERELAGWLSIDAANGVVRGEGMRQLQGMMAGIGDGISGIGKAFKNVDDVSKLDYVPHQIPGALGRIINLPGDALRGMDNFFKAILTKGDYYATALEQGSHLGLKGRELADYVARRVIMPTAAMKEHAEGFALAQTFANDLGTIGKHIQGIAQTGPLVYWFPFMKTPMNLAKYAWNRTPGLQLLSQSLYKDILAGGVQADMAIARLTLSNMMGLFFYGLAQEGLITGGGPADPTLKRSWNKQPYSIMGDKGWYLYSNLEPASTAMALAADFAEIHNQLDEPTAGQMAMMIGLAGVRDIADKSYWRTVGQLVDLLGSVKTGEEPGNAVLKAAVSPVTTALTLGPVGSFTTRATDPVTREARSFMDQIRARIPGYSKDLPPLRDGYGDPVIPPQTLGHAYLGAISPFVYKPDEQDPIKQEGAKLSVRLPQFPWSTGGGRLRDDFDVRAPLPGEAIPVELTPEQRDRWQVIYRNIIRDENNGLPALMKDERYQNATYAAKREMFSDMIAKSRSAAKAALLTEDTELAKNVARSSAGKYLPMISPEQRPEVEAQLNESLDLMDNLLPEQRDNLLKYGILESGKERDDYILRLNIEKSIPELNEAARGQGQSHPVTYEGSNP